MFNSQKKIFIIANVENEFCLNEIYYFYSEMINIGSHHRKEYSSIPGEQFIY